MREKDRNGTVVTTVKLLAAGKKTDDLSRVPRCRVDSFSRTGKKSRKKEKGKKVDEGENFASSRRDSSPASSFSRSTDASLDFIFPPRKSPSTSIILSYCFSYPLSSRPAPGPSRSQNTATTSLEMSTSCFPSSTFRCSLRPIPAHGGLFICSRIIRILRYRTSHFVRI